MMVLIGCKNYNNDLFFKNKNIIYKNKMKKITNFV